MKSGLYIDEAQMKQNPEPGTVLVADPDSRFTQRTGKYLFGYVVDESHVQPIVNGWQSLMGDAQRSSLGCECFRHADGQYRSVGIVVRLDKDDLPDQFSLGDEQFAALVEDLGGIVLSLKGRSWPGLE